MTNGDSGATRAIKDCTSFRLDEDMRARVTRLAKRADCPRSYVLRAALIKGLAEMESASGERQFISYIRERKLKARSHGRYPAAL